jgi:hydrogenase small subunit
VYLTGIVVKHKFFRNRKGEQHMPNKGESIKDALMQRGVTRRDFLKFCGMMACALALPTSATSKIANALADPKKRTPVIWLEMQDCAGCSEGLLRASSPTVAELVLDVLSVDYHETIMAPSGRAAEKSRLDAIAAGGYLLVVEGSLSPAADGVYCCIGGKSSVDLLKESEDNALAIIAIGNCAAFGGIPAASPNPTGAVGVRDVIVDKPVLNLPGCPANPVNLTATVVHFLTFGSLPEMDKLGRPLFGFGHLIHDNCERRGHFSAGEFVMEWGDEGHRNGWCLYKMGCKGPMSYHNCPTVRYNDGTSWPIGSGHPCIGCSEPGFWDLPTYKPIQLADYLPPNTYPPIEAPVGQIEPAGLALSGATVGAIVGAAGAFAYTVVTHRAKGVQPEVAEEEHTEEHDTTHG